MEEVEQETCNSSEGVEESTADASLISATADSNQEEEEEKKEEEEEEEIIDVSGKKLGFPLISPSTALSKPVNGLYIFNNSFNLVPESVGEMKGLKTLKFFGNEVDIFPPEVGELVDLECLQVKVSSPGFGNFELQKMTELRELDLCMSPPRSSVMFSLFCRLGYLKCLTRLSVRNFSITYLPPEIGSLKKLEHLDLSFNKLKRLPSDICNLIALKCLRVASNKLVELPSGLPCLSSLELMDVSNNRLTTIHPLDLSLMQTLRYLDLKYNKLQKRFKVPSWMYCNLKGNEQESALLEAPTSSSEEDIVDAVECVTECISMDGCESSSSASDMALRTKRAANRKVRKGCSRIECQQEKARRERLNNSRRWKSDFCDQLMTVKSAVELKPDITESGKHCQPGSTNEEDQIGECSRVLADPLGVTSCPSLVSEVVTDKVIASEGCGSSELVNNEVEVHCGCGQEDSVSSRPQSDDEVHRDGGKRRAQKSNLKSKRQSDSSLSNPKPGKCRKPVDDCLKLSFKYSTESFCSIDDYLPDGFYDAGRDRPFIPLEKYEQSYCLESREVILVDREKDEDLHAFALSARRLLWSIEQAKNTIDERMCDVDNFLRASVLALFVSDCFGGSDKSMNVIRMHRAVSDPNLQHPFVCTCPTGNNKGSQITNNEVSAPNDGLDFKNLCEASLRFIKERRNSNVVPIGSLRYGICRHRAVLMKYLCDRAEPPIPCELVRGFLDFMPHAWNVVVVTKDDGWRRMVVDACNPFDIRDERDREFFFRYIPLSRFHTPLSNTDCIQYSGGALPSLSECDLLDAKGAGCFVKRCVFGNTVAAAKVRTVALYVNSREEKTKFEYTCLGEVRMLHAVKPHPCIVEIYGHRISSKWVGEGNGKEGHLLMQSIILMECVEAGSLKSYIDKVAKKGAQHVPVELALSVARDVSCALVEVHSKHIIHRDIKSQNILLDVDTKRSDGSPLVKLCDFDVAVPLLSLSHSCCNGHLGIPSPNCCVGTPRWMAPEMMMASKTREPYGMEVDIWSYGCLLYELLMLQVPYCGLSDIKVLDALQNKCRPSLSPELEELAVPDTACEVAAEIADDKKKLKLLVDLFTSCTQGDPAARPSALEAYNMLCDISSTITQGPS